MNPIASRVALAPIVAGAAAIFTDEEILRVVDVAVRPALNTLDHLSNRSCSQILIQQDMQDIAHSRLKIHEDGAWDVACIITLHKSICPASFIEDE